MGLLIITMFSDPATRRGRAAEALFAGLAATSGVVAIYAIPGLVVRAWRNQSRHSLLILGIAAGGLTVEGIQVLSAGRQGDISTVLAELGTTARIAAVRLFGVAALGPSGPSKLMAGGPTTLYMWTVVGALATGLGLMWARIAVSAKTRPEAVALAATVVGGIGLALWSGAAAGSPTDALLWPGAAARYMIIPSVAVYLGLAIVRLRGPVSWAVWALCAGTLAVGIAIGYDFRENDPVDWHRFAECIEAREPVCQTVIPPAWQLEVRPPR